MLNGLVCGYPSHVNLQPPHFISLVALCLRQAANHKMADLVWSDVIRIRGDIAPPRSMDDLI